MCGHRVMFAAGLVGLSLAGSATHAAWTATLLNPTWAPVGSQGFGLRGGQQAGNVQIGVNVHAAIWSGTAASAVDIHPSGWLDSYLHDTNGLTQVGWVSAVGSGNLRAAMWNGTSAVTVLHPTGATASQAMAVHGAQQVGFASFGGYLGAQAGMWSGSSGSWTSLHPTWAAGSSAFGTDGVHQVGQTTATRGGRSQASMWTGTTASWTSLAPLSATDSWAYDVDAGQQVGEARIGGKQRAALWTGTASSFIDLTPGSVNHAQALGVDAGYQVGIAGSHAAIWNGTASTWFDLHSVLPANFTESWAESVEVSGNMICVVGRARDGAAGFGTAVLWCQTIPTPGTGIVAAAGLMLAARRRRAR